MFLYEEWYAERCQFQQPPIGKDWMALEELRDEVFEEHVWIEGKGYYSSKVSLPLETCKILCVIPQGMGVYHR